MRLLRGMLDLNPQSRLSAADCLKQDYFTSEDTEQSSDSEAEDVPEELNNLEKNMELFKGYMKNNVIASKNSIIYKLNPTIKGETDTYGSVNGNSPGSKQSNKIASINSPGPTSSKQFVIKKVQ
jgi:serine/threonine protein kinase